MGTKLRPISQAVNVAMDKTAYVVAVMFASLEIWLLLNMNGLRIRCIDLLMTGQHLILVFIDYSEVLDDCIRSLRM